ncbi:hypothetical protein V501_02547 [Pseudogymnoascus sp. VKM F-4519 (FW-2642)]|nr:hypothetical protein V499_08275 [Pseudogymnoascus sp. VKM F-103]KFZ15797.1 hypothetical protein V501_02547 [Pseudogymnoascus sp. VKM F-4519 (FW-2642)]
MHATATVNGQVIAETDNYEVVEGNIYGDASYYNITTGKTELKDAAWYYPETFEKANHIKNYVAFYKTKVDVKSE